MRAEKFEDIQGWREAQCLTRKVHELAKQPSFQQESGLRRQMEEASVSIMANIAEGFDRQSREEFIRFLFYASGSTSEVQRHLYVARDQRCISLSDFQETYDQARRTKGSIHGFISYLKGKREC
ncbi:MAG TPA: four helix bundle protein [Thermodesulfobacteriota bacterium]|nr:four helix bundle protein [Thermodesulfobacteriota bacterium]